MYIICRDILFVNEVFESEIYQGIFLVFYGVKLNVKVQDLLVKFVDLMENRFFYIDIVEVIFIGLFLNWLENGLDSIFG